MLLLRSLIWAEQIGFRSFSSRVAIWLCPQCLVTKFGCHWFRLSKLASNFGRAEWHLGYAQYLITNFGGHLFGLNKVTSIHARVLCCCCLVLCSLMLHGNGWCLGHICKSEVVGVCLYSLHWASFLKYWHNNPCISDVTL